jgi:hypothetical protein
MAKHTFDGLRAEYRRLWDKAVITKAARPVGAKMANGYNPHKTRRPTLKQNSTLQNLNNNG